MRPSERLTSAVLLALAFAAAAGARRPDLALLYLGLGAATFVLAGRSGSRAGALLRFLAPVGVVVLVYLSLEPVIAGVNPRRWDAFFSAFDDRWLPGIVPAWRGALGRPGVLTDASYAVYLSYYLLPVAAGALARLRSEAEGERAVFAILLCFWASYAGYFLFPTEGPRLPVAEEAGLGGGAVSEAARTFLRHAGRTRVDAFPSGHTSVSLVAAALGLRAAPRAGWALLAWALAIVFTTVYVHVHYAVDVLAGVLLAGAVLLTARRLSALVGGAGAAPAPQAPPSGT